MTRHILSLENRSIHTLYFVAAPSVGMVKIGITDSLEQRVRGLSAQSPVPLELLLAVPGTTRQEAALHHRFLDEHSHGEWFRASPRLLAFVEELRRAPRKEAARRLTRLRWSRRKRQFLAPQLDFDLMVGRVRA